MTTRSGWIQEYNAQVAVSDDHLILATALTQQPVDTPSFESMMRAAIGAANILNTARTAHDTLGECEAA